jgi:uncharacterized protein (DUF924 family)
MTAADVIAFWFGAPPLASRREWFARSDEFDESIRQRFGTLVERALAGPLGWGDDAASRLAEIVVLDQFPRNLFRGQARAFAGDARARSIALALIGAGADQALHPLQRWFVYLPLEHAEDLALQDRSVALFEALAAADPETAGALDYAHRHREVIRRFGRFPHRNAALGRSSTADELACLAQPGSGF